jgi:DNA-binding transcriptional ArsR family regulator
MEVITEAQAREIGRVLANNTKIRMLLALAKSPLPKGKIAETLDVAWSTAWAYLKDLQEAGLVEEYYFTDGTGGKTMIKLKHKSITIDLEKVSEKRAKTS